jgi:hypothetical protein
MLNNVKDFGAHGNGLTDDRVAIQTAIDEAVAHGKGGIFLPAGVYRVSRNGTRRCSLELSGVRDFMVRGEGSASVVKLVDTTARTGDWHVFVLRDNCRSVVFRDVVVDGNRTGLTEPDEQSHGITLLDGTDDVLVTGCTMRECHGDGLRLAGTAAAGEHVTRVRVESCLFETNRRTGLAIQRAVEKVVVANCIFDSTVHGQDIDFEPTGADGPVDFIISGCIVKHANRSAAVALSGIGGSAPLVRAKFTDNVVVGGQVFSTDVHQLTVQNNVIIMEEQPEGNRIALNVQRGGDTLLITGNLVVNAGTDAEAVLRLSQVNRRPARRALVANNLCISHSGSGIAVLSSHDIAVEGNMIVAAGTCTHGIAVRSEAANVDNLSIRGNDIITQDQGDWITGIRLAASRPHQILEVSIVDNSIAGAPTGIEFDGAGFRRTPMTALNRMASTVVEPLTGVAHLPEEAIVTGGTASRGGPIGAGRSLAGLGSPENRVTGNVGDLYQRIDAGPGAALYVKETGDGTTGWQAK